MFAVRHRRWLGLIIPLALLAWWQMQAGRDALPAYLPAPGIIATQWLDMARSGELAGHAGISVFRALAAFAIGAFCGAAIGLLAGALRVVEGFYEPIISLTYPVPKIAALPIIFAWFGLGEMSKIVIITVSVFYPVYVAALAGAKTTSRVHVWAARNMGASRTQIFFKVVLPSALPQLFNGLRVGLALAFVVMFVAELVSSSKGLGYLIAFAEQNMRFDMMYVAIITIGLIGFVADRLLLVVRRRVLVGQMAATEGGR